MSDWKKDFNGVSIKYNKKLVQIKTDKCLLGYLEKKGNGSLDLADYILKTYQSVWGCVLDISRESLSIEILIHAYLDVFSDKIETISKAVSPKELEDLIAYMEKIKGHTNVIDSGEKSVDSNRFIFDALVPFKDLIYFMLGRYA